MKSEDTNKEKTTFSSIFRLIDKDVYLYYNIETREVGLLNSFKDIKFMQGKLIPKGLNLIGGKLAQLPTFEKIDHKSIMTYFVKECVEDKISRKKLFDTLRNQDNYMEKFISACKELSLYEEYENVSEDFYVQLANEWIEENNIDLTRSNCL